MNWAKVINSKYFLISILIIITIFFRSYQIKDRYIFDWDQEDDAIKVTEMVKNFKPRLIGPRVANESGFFVGPFHYYFLAPFFIATLGNPYSGAYAAIFIAIITSVTAYFLISKIYNPTVAFFSALFIAASPTVVSWNVMYTPILSILIFYLCYLLKKGNKVVFPYIFLVYSFSFSTHLVPAILILPIIATILLTKYRPTQKQMLLSIALFIIPHTPLIVFDLKHDFINFLSLKSFIFSPKQVSENVPYLFLRTFWRSINPLFLTNSFLIVFSKLSIIIISLYEIIKTQNNKWRLFLLIWVISPLIVLAFYHGNIPEYYYGTTLIIFPILLSSYISRFHSMPLYLVIIVFFLIIQSQFFLTKTAGITLKNKLNLVKYLTTQSEDKIFNLSYDLPFGLNSGYTYLFKYFGREPQNIPEGHLYSVYLSSKPPTSGQIVYSDNVLGLVRK